MENLPTAEEFLLGGGTKSAFTKDDPVGTTVAGEVIKAEPRQQTDMETGEPLFWPDGKRRVQLVVTLKTDLRDPSDPDDDGVRAIYVKGSKEPGSKSLYDAVSSAVRRVRANGLEPGGKLTVQFVGTEPSKTRGFNDRKLWFAAYDPPDPAAASGDFLGTMPTAQPMQQQPQPQAVQQQLPLTAQQPTQPAPAQQAPVQQPAPQSAPTSGQPPAQIAQQLIALGQSDEAVAAATGLDLSVIQVIRTTVP